MNNYTILENPYTNKAITSDGTYKVAKMSQLDKTPKIQTLKAKWKKELESVVKTVTTTAKNTFDNGIMVMNKLGADFVDFYEKVKSISARKLKVNPDAVEKKIRKLYGSRDAIVLKKPETKIVESKDLDFVKEELKEDKVDTVLTDSRVSRLEKTGEIDLPVEEEKKEKYESPVINTPTRFERNNSAYDSLINDTPSMPLENDVESHMKNNEMPGGDIDRYTALLHGSPDENDFNANSIDSSSILSAIEATNSKLRDAEDKRKKAAEINAQTRGILSELVRKYEENEKIIKGDLQRKLADANDKLAQTKDAILAETAAYGDLAAKVAEYTKKIEEQKRLIENNNEDVYSYSRSR